jgi:hypothetical protein
LRCAALSDAKGQQQTLLSCFSESDNSLVGGR